MKPACCGRDRGVACLLGGDFVLVSSWDPARVFATFAGKPAHYCERHADRAYVAMRGRWRVVRASDPDGGRP